MQESFVLMPISKPLLPTTAPDTSNEPHHLITDKTYLPSLEGWRGVVALFVVAYHFSRLFFGERYASFGYLGVEFFFILSGFIIARQYEADIAMHKISFKKFAIRRVSRLWPLYIVSIAFSLTVHHYYIEPIIIKQHMQEDMDFGIGPMFWYHMFLQLTMLGNVTTMAQPNGPAWSVSVEWIVNLVFFAIVWRYRRIPNALIMLIIAACAVYLVNLTPHSIQEGLYAALFFNPPIARGIIGFCLGWLIFHYHRKLPKLNWFVMLMLDAILIGATAALMYYHEYPFVISVDYVFALIMFPALVTVSLYRHSFIGWFFSLPQCRFLGRISYSIYLLHHPLAYFMEYNPTIHEAVQPYSGIYYVLALIAVSSLSYMLIEVPGRWVGRKLTR